MAESSLKKIPIQERAIPVGNFVVINAYHVNKETLKKRFTEGGYTVHETPHFLLFTRLEAPSIVIAHWFGPNELNADVKHYLTQELKPFGILTQSSYFGEVLSGIIGSFFPEDTRRAWRLFGANTLQRFLTFLATAYTPPLPDYATIGMFATLYQRVCELCVGESFLDAGCASGFLPLLIAERLPFVKEIVGIDINEEAFTTARELSEERGLTCVRFAQGDLLADDFISIGVFDTVTALHVLEHFSEAEMYEVLKNLLQVTAHRLIIAVPYEKETPETAYGHLQLFSHTKLETLGAWCTWQLRGYGRVYCEDLVGGLLLIEKIPR